MFFVFNKQKIYTYLVSVVTVVLLFCIANTINTKQNTIQASTTDSGLTEKNMTNNINNTNDEKNNVLINSEISIEK